MRFILAIAVTLLSCLPSVNSAGRNGWPIVCITFDDGSNTIYSVAFRDMRAVDTTFTATHFLPVTFVNTPGSVTLDNLMEMEAAGWETGGHGYKHLDLSSLPLDSVEYQVKMSYNYLDSNHLHHASFAYPSGGYTAAVEAIAAKWFKNIRTAGDKLYTDGVNRKELGYFAVKSGHSADDLIARVERARDIGAPLVIIGFHIVEPDSVNPVTNAYWCHEAVFKGFLNYLKKQELSVMTIDKAMSVVATGG